MGLQKFRYGIIQRVSLSYLVGMVLFNSVLYCSALDSNLERLPDT